MFHHLVQEEGYHMVVHIPGTADPDFGVRLFLQSSPSQFEGSHKGGSLGVTYALNAEPFFHVPFGEFGQPEIGLGKDPPGIVHGNVGDGGDQVVIPHGGLPLVVKHLCGFGQLIETFHDVLTDFKTPGAGGLNE